MMAVNVVMSKESIQENRDTVEGEWYTELALKKLEHWNEFWT